MTTTAIDLIIARMDFVDNVLAHVNGPRIVSFISDTPVGMNKYDAYWHMVNGERKKNPNAIANPYFADGIRCLAKKYMINTGFDYLTALDGRAEAEGIVDYEHESGDIWYNLVSKGLAVHKNNPNKFYFRYQYVKDKSTVWTEYSHNGQQIELNSFRQYLDKPTDYAGQGLQKTLNVQVVAIENLVELTMGGIRYIME